MELKKLPKGFEVVEFYFSERCKKLGISIENLCLFAGVDISTLYRWRFKGVRPSGATLDRIEETMLKFEKPSQGLQRMVVI